MERQQILAVVQTDLQMICALRASLEDAGLGQLAIARNSQEAILYLRGVGIYGDRNRHPLPEIVLLDCSNADGSDLDVLAWMRSRPEFRRTPVVMLCADLHHPQRISCALDAYCLLVDRENLQELTDAVGALEAAQIYAATAA